MRKPFDHVGRALSLLIFLAGIGLLVVVFVVAYHMLTSPVPGLHEAIAASNSKAGSASQQPLWGMSSAVLSFVLRLAVLFVMTIAASLIAARGIHLYFAAVGAGNTDHPNTAPVSGEANGAQSATAPAGSSGNRASREGPSKREGAGGAPSGETVSGPRQ